MSSDNRKLWTLIGLAAGAAAGLWLWRRSTERTPEAVPPRPRTPVEGDAAARLTRALADDIELAGWELEVHAISDGVLELAGELAEPEQRARVVAMAHNIDGVHTVVNRIVLQDEEARAAAARARAEESGTLQHTGMGVGMGTRRQSPDTDPDRPSDRQKRVERELEVDRMMKETVLEPEPGKEEEPGAAGPDETGESDGDRTPS